LHGTQKACAAAYVKTREPLDAALLKQLVPAADEEMVKVWPLVTETRLASVMSVPLIPSEDSTNRVPELMLLDAAHIVADKDERLGQPVVPNPPTPSAPSHITLSGTKH
jgi:hypothetical protein